MKSVHYLKGEPFREVFPLIEAVDLPNGSLKTIMNTIFKFERGYTLLCLNENELSEVVEYCVDHDIFYNLYLDDKLVPGLNLTMSSINEGFEIKELDLIVYTSKELFQNKKVVGGYARKYEEATKLN